jgi:hypothetical protein
VTAEFGVAFSLIQHWTGEPQIKSPTVHRCHLRGRLGWFMAAGEDRWWQLTEHPWPEPMPELIGGVAAGLVDAVVDVGASSLRRLMQPGEAISYWLGEHAGFFGYEEPLRYAAIMAASTESSRHLLPEIMARARALEFPSPGLESELERIGRMAEQRA